MGPALAGLLALAAAWLPRQAHAAAFAGFSARFELRENGATGSPSTGTLAVDSTGHAYLAVESPVLQRLWLGRDGLTLWYPSDRLVLRSIPGTKTPPSALDAVLTAIRTPGELMRGKGVLTSRTREGEALVTRWSVRDETGRPVGTMLVRETAEATASVEVGGPAGEPHVRYAFGDYRRVGELRVPRAIDAAYLGANGAVARRESWRLDAPRALDAAMRRLLAGPPPFPPGTKIRPLVRG